MAKQLNKSSNFDINSDEGWNKIPRFQQFGRRHLELKEAYDRHNYILSELTLSIIANKFKLEKLFPRTKSEEGNSLSVAYFHLQTNYPESVTRY